MVPAAAIAPVAGAFPSRPAGPRSASAASLVVTALEGARDNRQFDETGSSVFAPSPRGEMVEAI